MEYDVNGTPHVPIAEAAAMLHTTHLRILMLIKQKVMAGCQVDGEWFVEKGSLTCFRNYETDRGDKKDCPSSCHGCSGK